MNKDIKIAYNWIGPKGPIPNTEVPNVLHLAQVGERTSTDSYKFWSDSIWHLIFCNQPGFTLGSTHYLTDKDVFIYPFNLPWRIDFTNYFYVTSGIFEYSHTPNSVLHHVRINNGFILIEDAAEAHVTHPQLDSLHTYFTANNIPLNKVFYLTGCMNAEQLYNEYCILRGHQQNNLLNIISYPVSQDALARYFVDFNPQVPDYDVNKVPEKLFLSWNRRFRQHRIALTFGLDKLGLIDRSYVSIGLVDPENPNFHITHAYNEYLLAKLNVTNEDKIKFVNKLPLLLDGENDVNQMCQDFNDATRPYYQNSLVSLITETNFDAAEVSLTEKSFKPIKEKHPWISVGAPGTLQALKDMGFKTFSEFWDESYDITNNSQERMTKILDVCKYIGSWDNQKIIDFRSRIKPILDYNYENLKNRYVNIITQKIKNKISSLVVEK